MTPKNWKMFEKFLITNKRKERTKEMRSNLPLTSSHAAIFDIFFQFLNFGSKHLSDSSLTMRTIEPNNYLLLLRKLNSPGLGATQ